MVLVAVTVRKEGNERVPCNTSWPTNFALVVRRDIDFEDPLKEDSAGWGVAGLV